MKALQEPKYDIVRGKIKNRDTGVSIPDFEPIMIFRAQDKNLVPLLRTYKKMCKDNNHKKVIQARINQIVQWQRDHKQTVKEPDTEKVDNIKARIES